MIATTEPKNSHSSEASLVAYEDNETVATPTVQVDTPTAASVSDPKVQEFQRLHEIVKKGASAFIDVGQALRKIQEGVLWQAGGYTTWEGYCDSVLDVSRSYVRRLIKSSTVVTELRANVPNGTSDGYLLPLTEAQVRPLLRLKDPEKRKEAWEKAQEKAGGQPTAAQVTEAVLELLPAKKNEAVNKPSISKAQTPSPQSPVLPTAKATELITQLRNVVDEGQSWEAVERILSEMEDLLSVTNVAA